MSIYETIERASRTVRSGPWYMMRAATVLTKKDIQNRLEDIQADADEARRALEHMEDGKEYTIDEVRSYGKER